MKRICGVLFAVFVATPGLRAAPLPSTRVQLLCHRTANKDTPENTLASLEQAALLGCDVVEIDLRRTLDGKIVLNHDGLLERLTNGAGEVEKSYYDDLQMLDAGSWMGERFEGIHMALFEDALRLARERNIKLVLDIKDKGMESDVARLVQREGMLKQVQFPGEWGDVYKKLYPDMNAGPAVIWVQPGVTVQQIKAHHDAGKMVVVNFSANDYEMDLTAMKAAVAAGADGINVDFPRLGADAVGRPVERKLEALEAKADAGESSSRSEAILELSRYRGFPLQEEFVHWMLDSDGPVSYAAALALTTARPQTPVSAFAEALRSDHADTRANAAWALGAMKAPAATLLPLLQDHDPQVLQTTLMALTHMPGEVSTVALLPLLTNDNLMVKGAAAMALAQHQPSVASTAVPEQLQQMRTRLTTMWQDYERRGKPTLTDADVQPIKAAYRCEMELVQATSMVKGPAATQALEQHAFRPGKDFSVDSTNMSAFELWDRIGADPLPALQALGSSDIQVADRAEWMLVKDGAAVLPAVRKALNDPNRQVRKRAIQIVAWQGDIESLEILQSMQTRDVADADLLKWAIDKINSLHPRLSIR
jgi:glycerophosphoryl diester phosphodiesterase/HEAT repeat protein